MRRTIFLLLGLLVAGLASASVSRPGKTAAGLLPPTSQAKARQDISGIKNISCEQAREIIQDRRQDPNFIILDFRTNEMFDESHIAGVHVEKQPAVRFLAEHDILRETQHVHALL